MSQNIYLFLNILYEILSKYKHFSTDILKKKWVGVFWT